MCSTCASWIPFLVAATALLACACGPDAGEGEGTLGIAIWGEEFIDEGIPADEFADGWAVTFDRFLVTVGAISIAGEDGLEALSDPVYRVHDLTRTTDPAAIAAVTAPEGTYSHTAYTIAPAKAGTLPGNVTEEAVEAMVDGGLSVLVEGKATDGQKTVAFSWGFKTTTRYNPCHSTARLAAGGHATVQITIHGDHLFYDDATSETPSLRFADIARADADADGQVTEQELRAYDIRSLPNYGVGNLHIDDLWGFIEHMTTTLGHIDGEGHCETGG